MKKLGKLSINQSKLLKNEELVNLRGGYVGTQCGPGFTQRMCMIMACDGCVLEGPYYVCLAPGQTEEEELRKHYPDLHFFGCADFIY